jgi:serine/threonine-protein kinase HipA
MHSLSGLLHANFRIPNLDYVDFLMATWLVIKDIVEVKHAFTQMIFNVLFHNRDDHSKNFAFIFKDNSWQLSPAYDLTFSTGIGGEHTMTVAGEGANPSTPHFLKAAEKANIPKKEALIIIDRILEVRSRWQSYAKTANVSTKIAKQLERAMPKI